MNAKRLKHEKIAKARQKLASDLAGFTSKHLALSLEDNEMLSLLVDEVLQGVDIKTQYPDSYSRLLNNPELRQLFLDILESLEADTESRLEHLPVGKEPNLAFLKNKEPRPESQKPWQVTLQRTIRQLQDIFSPPQLAYRADPSLYEDSWFTLLREDIELGGASYSILLECGLSEETEQALSAALNVAILLESKAAPDSPLQATLRWGNYTETLTIAGEGRAQFRDIPFSETFDPQNQQIKSNLDLVLEVEPTTRHAG